MIEILTFEEFLNLTEAPNAHHGSWDGEYMMSYLDTTMNLGAINKEFSLLGLFLITNIICI